MKTVVGLYDHMQDARNAIQELTQIGVDRDNISLLTPDPNQEYADFLTKHDTTGETITEGAVGGAVVGGALGGLTGVLLGLGALAIPGIGPVVVAGPIAAGLMGTGIGAAAGGVLGALVGWGIPEEEAQYYAEGVRQGSTLVAVKTPDASADEVARIMNRHRPVDVHQRAEQWRASGWSGYDPNAELVRPEDTRAAQLDATDYAYAEDDYQRHVPSFREHYDTHYKASNYQFDFYDPAYRYGYGLAYDERYRGQPWTNLEPIARDRWLSRDNDSTWEDIKDAVRRGWEEVTAGVFDEDYREEYRDEEYPARTYTY